MRYTNKNVYYSKLHRLISLTLVGAIAITAIPAHAMFMNILSSVANYFNKHESEVANMPTEEETTEEKKTPIDIDILANQVTKYGRGVGYHNLHLILQLIESLSPDTLNADKNLINLFERVLEIRIEYAIPSYDRGEVANIFLEKPGLLFDEKNKKFLQALIAPGDFELLNYITRELSKNDSKKLLKELLLLSFGKGLQIDLNLTLLVLIGLGADIDFVDERGMSPLALAIEAQRDAGVQLLARLNPQAILMQDNRGRTPFHMEELTYNDFFHLLEIIRKHNQPESEDVLRKQDKNKNIPLHIIASLNHAIAQSKQFIEFLKLIYKLAGPIEETDGLANMQNNDGDTPLHIAMRGPHVNNKGNGLNINLIRLLFLITNLDLVNNQNRTPAQELTKFHPCEARELLLTLNKSLRPDCGEPETEVGDMCYNNCPSDEEDDEIFGKESEEKLLPATAPQEDSVHDHEGDLSSQGAKAPKKPDFTVQEINNMISENNKIILIDGNGRTGFHSIKSFWELAKALIRLAEFDQYDYYDETGKNRYQRIRVNVSPCTGHLAKFIEYVEDNKKSHGSGSSISEFKGATLEAVIKYLNENQPSLRVTLNLQDIWGDTVLHIVARDASPFDVVKLIQTYILLGVNPFLQNRVELTPWNMLQMRADFDPMRADFDPEFSELLRLLTPPADVEERHVPATPTEVHMPVTTFRTNLFQGHSI